MSRKNNSINWALCEFIAVLLTLLLMSIGLVQANAENTAGNNKQEQVSANDSHCLPEEETVFSCAAGKKVISICASKDISTTSGYMQYRFGAINAVEITIPETKEHPKKNVEAGTFFTANGGRTGHIRFKKGEYGYVVYWAEVRGEYSADGTRGWEYYQGVVVEYKGKKIANIKCQLPSKKEPGDKYLFSTVGLTKSEDLVYYDVP